MIKNQPEVSLRIRNFRSFEDITIQLKPIVLLFGNNGSGKSSLIKAIRFFFYNLFNAGYSGFSIDEQNLSFNFEDINLFSFKDTVLNNDVSKVMFFELTMKNVVGGFYFIPNDLRQTIEKYKIYENEEEFREETEKLSFKVFLRISQQDEKLFFSFGIYDLKTNEIYYLDKIDTCNDVESYIQNKHQSMNNYPDKIINPFKEFSSEFLLAQLDNLLLEEDQINKQINKPYYKKFIKFRYIIPKTLLAYFESKKLFANVPAVREKPPKYFDLEGDFFKHNDYYHIPYLYCISNKYTQEYEIISISIIDENGRETFFPKKITEKPSKNRNTLQKTYHELENSTPWGIINFEINEMGLASKLIMHKNNELGIGWIEYVSIDGKSKSNLTEACSGLLQILPILGVILEKEDESSKLSNVVIFSIEQPELHLHPKLQSKLVDFFLRYLDFRFNKEFTSLIIETHSEHFLKKLQVLIANDLELPTHYDNEVSGPKLKDLVKIYFFDKNDESGITKLKEIEILDNGFLKEPFPEGFFDESTELEFSLLEAQLKRKN
ncbi:MAG: DUF3696 domain-containing protein [Ignavibacteria bacterium]|jgi:predicted ATPase|nr:DUF3696 domain-containing protein [Ignavibacteria bacterium]MDH7528348.1 DUF3696 domain-containing protein [Ignavibacteria bacterium]